ncbi:MAG: CapA family protein [Lachnospiraceae bacterium]|nr:CapA family protein [Lachnospiraceae bacterium]
MDKKGESTIVFLWVANIFMNYISKGMKRHNSGNKTGFRNILQKASMAFAITIIALNVTGCKKTPVGGVNLDGLDIEEISSTEKLVQTPKPTAEVTEEPAVDNLSNMEGLSVIAVGDNIYHDNIIESGKSDDGTYNYDHIYSHISEEIGSADLAIVNQETVFCPTGKKPKGYPEFLTPVEALDAMTKAGFNVFLMATNHAADNGTDAILFSMNLLRGFDNINYVGINEKESDKDNIKIIEQEGIKVAILNYTEIMNKSLSSKYSYMVNRLKEDRLRTDIKKAKEEADVVMVFPHWGTEYSHDVSDSQKKWTNIMVEEGADVIIGTHPHVIQPVDVLTSQDGHKTLVYYSLGNFVSRQIEGPRLLGGMAKMVFNKTEDGSVKITYASVTPLMMHYEQYPSRNTAIYKLEDYTPELSAAHGVKYYESLGEYSHEQILELSQSIFQTTTERIIEIPE